MTDEPGKPNGSAVTPPAAPNIGSLAMMSFSAQVNLMIAMGMPLTDCVNVLFEIACNLVAGVEPAQLRQNIVNEIRNNLPGIVERHWQARHTLQSGLVIPGRPS
jgi:hypothetical protein